jgi:molecular chaperone DnaK
MVIGIDLGTTFSVAAYVDNNGIPHVIPNGDGTNTTPSVVMFDYGEVIVGTQAKNNAVTSPYSVAQFAKRHMGTKFEFPIENESGEETLYSPEDISALILSKIKKDCEDFLGQPITGAVVTVPAYFTDAQKNSTIAAGKIANLNVLKVIHEPTAAAMAFGVNKQGENSKILIYDLGGGTFDVTAAEVKGRDIAVLATHGNRNLGGFDFDNLLIEYASRIIKETAKVDVNEELEDLQLLRQRCEEAKIALSTRKNYNFTMAIQGKKVRVEITREKFEELIKPLLDTTGDSIDIVLDEGNLKVNEIDKVLLVGGSSIIPAVSDFVYKKLGIKPSTEVNPHEVVAIGAAICANSLDSADSLDSPMKTSEPSDNSEDIETLTRKKVEKYNLIDRNSHGFGVVVMGRDGCSQMNSIIIPRNQPLKKPFTKVYSSLEDNQEEVYLKVTEGEEEDINYVNIIGESTITLNPHPEGSPIAIEFMYDDNGIITGRVYDLFGVPHETNKSGYLIGTISDLRNSVFMAEVTIKREFELTDDDIDKKKKHLTMLSIQ